MLKRLSAFRNRLKRHGWDRLWQAFLTGVRPGLHASSRMLVSALLGIVGVGAAASIALFAGGTDGGGERYVPAAALSQPLAAQERVRSGWLTLALDSSMPERYFDQLLSLVVELDAIEADGVRKTVYLLDDAAKDAFLASRPKHNREFQRLKGLGEMDWDELRSTTMDPQTRSLLQVSVEEAAIADQVISVLMGDDVEQRKNFIVTNAREVRNLDF